MSDLNALEITKKDVITKDYRVNGVKICSDSAKKLTGIQLQIG